MAPKRGSPTATLARSASEFPDSSLGDATAVLSGSGISGETAPGAGFTPGIGTGCGATRLGSELVMSGVEGTDHDSGVPPVYKSINVSLGADVGAFCYPLAGLLSS